jgi:cysteine desulfurase
VTYLDNNSTTRIDPAVLEAMLPFLTEQYANPSSVHRPGQTARAAVDEARQAVADAVGVRDRDLTFTGGGTEASNTAIAGLLQVRRDRDPRRTVIVTSAVEHDATRQTVERLVSAGAEHREIPVDDRGRFDLEALDAALDDRVALASFIWANNETGVIADLPAVVDRCDSAEVPLHVDATQCVGKLPVDLGAMGVRCATLSPHKFHGPKGVGVLVTGRGIRLPALVVGGPQERDRRGGTENVAGIVGAGVAARLAVEHLGEMTRVEALRDELEARVRATCGDVHVNGGGADRLPNTSNLGFRGLQAEAILLMLSEAEICASAGAACSSGSLEPSHVLRAMDVPEAFAHGSLRFSLSRFSQAEDLDRLLAVLPDVIERLGRVLPTG